MRLVLIHAAVLRGGRTTRTSLSGPTVFLPNAIFTHWSCAAVLVGFRDMAPKLTSRHVLVLGLIRVFPITFPEDVARLVGVTLDEARALCADLEAAGLIAPMPQH